MFAATIFLSAFLLFSMEPLVAKRILPWFGGSAAVWSTCLVFYQTALLAGYLYAYLTTRWLRPRWQVNVHFALLAISLVLLPIGPGARWKPLPLENPSWAILEALTATVGLPFALLSATSPLLQAWLVRLETTMPYRMFAVSNFASLAALLAYPFLIETMLGTASQARWWSFFYMVFVVVCMAAGWASWRSLVNAGSNDPVQETSASPGRTVWWLAWSACGSMLLLSITNQIDENVAAVPLLWVIPLAIYLLSFVLVFGGLKIYSRSLWMRILAFSLGILGYAIYNINAVEAIQVSLPIFLAGLFVCCLFCHGELNRSRPPAGGLAGFYLTIAAGGAAGAIFVGLIAPLIFSAVYELPLTLIFVSLLALALSWGDRSWPVKVLWVGVTGCMLMVMITNVEAYHQNSVSLRRSFYGSLRVVQSKYGGPEQQRILYHGTIEHGAEYLLPPKRSRPTTYYGRDSGIGILLRECFGGHKRVGVVGLGVGTLGAYAQPGDSFEFFEINPQMAEIAQTLFYYLRDMPAKGQIVIGDGRLSLEKEQGDPFDVLVLDAFSGDAIPMHLLTREAILLYLRHLRPEGVLAFHVSNNYLDLAPVVGQLAAMSRYKSVLVHSHADIDEGTLSSDWVLVTNNAEVMENPSIRVNSRPISPRKGLRPWTDDYNNLLQVFKTPELR